MCLLLAILEYLGGIETKTHIQDIPQNPKILEYLGGIETSHFKSLLNKSLLDFRIPRRDWNS